MKITSKQDYHTAMAEIESYLAKGFGDLTKAEDDRLYELTKAAEAWELNEFPMPVQPTFIDILRYIMINKDLTQKELSEQLSVSQATISEVLKGKKKPGLDMALGLHHTFKIDGNLILESMQA